VRHKTNGEKALRLAYWIPDGVRGRKPELEQFQQFHSEHGVDICLLNETHHEASKTIMFAY
jgi:hypothetical protein